MGNEKMLSVRLDKEAEEKLKKIVEVRGITESEAVRLSIKGMKILQIGNTCELAKEFCKVRTALEKNTWDETVERQVKTLCQSIRDVLQQVEKWDE